MKHKQINSSCSTAAIAVGSATPSSLITMTDTLNFLLINGSRPTLTVVMDEATRMIVGFHEST